MSEEGGIPPDASGVLPQLMLENCYLQCNPSSWHQRLVFASDNTSRNVEKLTQAKEHCVKGCMLSFVASMEVSNTGSSEDRMLADPVSASQILDKDAKRREINRMEAVLDGINDRCFQKCPALCKGVRQEVDPVTGKPVFQAYSHEDCMLNCAMGCKIFKDDLAYKG